MDAVSYLRFAGALLVVLALIGACGWLLRRFGGATGFVPAGRERRLRVVEVLAVDARRRLVLVRRDDVEHLLLLGQTQDLLVETHIAGRAEPGQATSPPRPFGARLVTPRSAAQAVSPSRTDAKDPSP